MLKLYFNQWLKKPHSKICLIVTTDDEFVYGDCVKAADCKNCRAIHESNRVFTGDSKVEVIE